MPLSLVPAWKEAPFLRLLPPLIGGILFQWYIMPAPALLLSILATAVPALLCLQALPIKLRFRLRFLNGIIINVLLVIIGSFIVYFNYPANKKDWLSYHYSGHESIQAVLQEPLSAKNRSFKAIAAAKKLFDNGNITNVSGNIIVYFSRDMKPPDLSYGSIIIINKPLIPVKSSGNPGAFNYKRYCTFAQIDYQVYLQPKDFTITGRSETRYLQQLIFWCRQNILNTLVTYIPGAKERALAEALLIGYKDELDKELVQAYSNTGVIHIIAVSGMHLGIIYLLLGRLLQPLRKKRSTRWLSFVLILAGLWAFSFLAGAGPSVVRSALMFSFMLIGDAFSKRSNIYNNLAASAFLLLCWNPFWLWDAGFQLSYAAVLSIVLFFKPVYNMLYVQNKLLDAGWKLNAVTISAQLLTLPLTIYHFHQFPNLFLLTNMVAVPLSSLLLIGEIVLCMVSFVPMLASSVGATLNFLTRFMNSFIEHINILPLASWTHLYITVPQAILLAVFIIAGAWWCMERWRPAFMTALGAFAIFMLLRGYSFTAAEAQHRLIVYNITGKAAIDFIEGRNYYFTGDASVQADPFLRNFHLEPSRIIYRAAAAAMLPGLLGNGPLFWFNGKRILVLDKDLAGDLQSSSTIDLLVLSKNPRLSLPHVLQSIRPQQVVADASNANWKLKQWEQECAAAHISFHSVSQSGAFVMDPY